VARILELAACTQKGISAIATHLEPVMCIIDSIMRIKGDKDLFQLKYPAATVLLDLTANEDCIQRVADEIF